MLIVKITSCCYTKTRIYCRIYKQYFTQNYQNAEQIDDSYHGLRVITAPLDNAIYFVYCISYICTHVKYLLYLNMTFYNIDWNCQRVLVRWCMNDWFLISEIDIECRYWRLPGTHTMKRLINYLRFSKTNNVDNFI